MAMVPPPPPPPPAGNHGAGPGHNVDDFAFIDTQFDNMRNHVKAMMKYHVTTKVGMIRNDPDYWDSLSDRGADVMFQRHDNYRDDYEAMVNQPPGKRPLTSKELAFFDLVKNKPYGPNGPKWPKGPNPNL